MTPSDPVGLPLNFLGPCVTNNSDQSNHFDNPYALMINQEGNCKIRIVYILFKENTGTLKVALRPQREMVDKPSSGLDEIPYLIFVTKATRILVYIFFGRCKLLQI